MYIVIPIVIIILIPLCILWVKGIDFMNENHPDYKGEDFFNEEEDEKKE